VKTYTFKPNYEIVGHLKGVRAISEIAEEVGLYSATPEFVQRHGGNISKEILAQIPDAYYDETKAKGLMVNIDIRIHRLYPGDFPAYPGWHCDGEFRETFFSQPDIDRINVSRHLICTLSSHEGGVSNTQFLDEDLTVDIEKPTSDHTLWGQVHKALTVQSTERELRTRMMQDGEMVLFDPWTLHRATATRIRGWRMFFRASQWHRPNLGGDGKLARQEQVYKLVEGGGW
jgi:hypothetical protein